MTTSSFIDDIELGPYYFDVDNPYGLSEREIAEARWKAENRSNMRISKPRGRLPRPSQNNGRISGHHALIGTPAPGGSGGSTKDTRNIFQKGWDAAKNLWNNFWSGVQNGIDAVGHAIGGQSWDNMRKVVNFQNPYVMAAIDLAMMFIPWGALLKGIGFGLRLAKAARWGHKWKMFNMGVKLGPRLRGSVFHAGKYMPRTGSKFSKLHGFHRGSNGRISPRISYYDDLGREIARTDYNARGRGNPFRHTHYYKWDPANGHQGTERKVHFDDWYDPNFWPLF